MQDPAERAEQIRGGAVSGIDAIAVVGLCAHERRRYAMELAKNRGYVFVPAEQTEQGIEIVDRLVALLGKTAGVRGFVLEYADDAACPEVIGALSAADSQAVLSDLVCVVDLMCFRSDLEAEERCGRLVAQIEFASTLALLAPVGAMAAGPIEGDAMADEAGVQEAVDLIAHLAPEARRFVLDGGSVHEPVCWDFGQRPPSAGWTAILNSEFIPPDHAERASGVRYEQARPFHPQRLQAVLVAALGEGCWGRIIRSAGFARLASRPYVTAHWDQTGTRLMLAPLTAGPYLGEGAELLALGQELAFIGIDLDEAGLTEALERAVLTDAELLAGPMAWLEYCDEFPAWHSAHPG
ncbi:MULTISPECIES: GTP-binding protein [unclassified Brevibacterium]|uniref:GTP-binding protein n=1 Tax=unclassified Brevibacterium TaxID=2614124 RepID=UPI00143DB4D4|nr:GTP-binding protein [Brevibacterium sp. S22]